MNIGEKIKAIRKQKKMTLVQVAGEQLSKGMLSLIENGKAQPSMESLQYIAKQLQIDISDLLQDETYEEVSKIYKQVDEITGYIHETESILKAEQYYKQIIHFIEPLVKNDLLHMDRFESIRLLELYYSSLFEIGQIEPPIEQFKNLEKAYEKIDAYSRMFNCGIMVASLFRYTKQYKEAYDYLNELEQYIEKYGGRIDDVERLKLYYQMAITSAIFNDSEKIEYAQNHMLEITKRSRIYYNVENLYRFLFFIHVEKKDKEKCNYYLNKLLSFVNISEEQADQFILQFLQLLYWNQIEGKYHQVIDHTINTFELPPDFLHHANIFAYGEKAYAHIMLEQYDKAKSFLQQIFVSKFYSHPIDLSFIYRTFAMRALCLYKEGDLENAKRDILYAIDGVKDFVMNRQKQMIHIIYEHIINNQPLNLKGELEN